MIKVEDTEKGMKVSIEGSNDVVAYEFLEALKLYGNHLVKSGMTEEGVKILFTQIVGTAYHDVVMDHRESDYEAFCKIDDDVWDKIIRGFGI